MRGEDVRLVQQFLKDEGYYTGRADGVYGPVSARSVRLFQEDNSLTVNGRVDSATIAKINAFIEGSSGSTPPPSTMSNGVLTIEPATISLNVGATVRVKAMYSSPCPTSGNAICRPTVTEVYPTWSIANTSIARLNQTTPRCVTGYTCPSPTTDVAGVAGGTTLLSAEYTDALGNRYERVANITVIAPVTNSSELAKVIGYADVIGCDIIGGWAINQNNPSAQTVIHIYDEVDNFRSMIARVETTGLRPDVNTAYSVTGNHGYTINTPASVKDGRNHKISVHGVGDNMVEAILTGSPQTITCPLAYSIGGSNLLASPLASLPVASTPSITQPAPISSYYFTQFLSEGAYGEEVSQLQKRLAKLGYYAGNIDSNFGPKLKEAVQKLQSANGFKVDGIVGYEVRTFLNN